MSRKPVLKSRTTSDARARHHSREQQPALFARRSSPKSPSPRPSEVITSRPPFKVRQPNHATQNPSSASGKPNLTMCASPSVKKREITPELLSCSVSRLCFPKRQAGALAQTFPAARSCRACETDARHHVRCWTRGLTFMRTKQNLREIQITCFHEALLARNRCWTCRAFIRQGEGNELGD